MGVEPEPVSPAKPAPAFAVRISFPDPVGLETDIVAALDRLLPALGDRLRAAGQGARRVRLDCHRADQATERIEVGLARPSWSPDRIRPLLLLKIGGIDAGFGIDRLRLEAVETEPLHDRQHRGHLEAASDGAARLSRDSALDDLLGRIGARIGLEAITRFHPADSHIPEKAAQVLAAAWSEPAQDWPPPAAPRPLLLWRPEPVTAGAGTDLPLAFRWRRRDFRTVAGAGPERIAPEWWLDDPDWRSGVRDYWRVATDTGETLWLFYAHGAAMSGGWFCQGSFR
jgi:protein ImuB